MTAFKRFYAGYGVLLHGFGFIAEVATLFMMLLVVANIISRYLFNHPVTGTLEITESLLVIVIFLSVAMTQYDGGHIRVNIVTRRLPRRWAQAATVVAMLAGALFFTWCAYATWLFAVQSWSFNEHEWGTIVFPLYPMKFVVFVGISLLAFQFLLDAIAETFMPIKADDEHAMEGL